ncbi:MAG: hydrophobe/amphiphile efflux-3 (HAE3) family protein [Halobacteriales archaeon]|jgi:hydrophobe/amphiphile efflux-3 (HAE3) family protein
MSPDVARAISENARIVIAVMVVASAVVAAGVPMLDRSTSLDQFQTDAEEADALDYADANFSTGSANTTTAQVIVEDENVLDRETLVAMLEYQERLQNNETISDTLVENDSTRSVANVVATAAIREDRVEALRDRQQDLNETKAALHETLEYLVKTPNASIRPAFDSVDANTSVNLTDEDYDYFEDRVEKLRAANSANASANRGNATNATAGNATANASAENRSVNATAPNASTNVTAGNETRNASAIQLTPEDGERNESARILADEFAELEADRAALEDLDPGLDSQIEELESLNESEIEDLVAKTLSGEENRSWRALAFMPDSYDPGDAEADATLLVVTQESPGGSFAPGDAPEEIEDSQAAMADLGPGDGSMSILVYGDGVVSSEILDSLTDSVLLVGPLAAVFVLLVLVTVYRDLLDILLGLGGIALVLLWTFGVMGWFGVAFSQPFIVVLVLLIGLSIDYGLHVVMRYREERPDSDVAPSQAMAVGLGSVGIALVYVTATTVIGFLSNLTSPLTIFQELGIVSAIGIVAALLVFGVLVPALKVELDAALESRGIDRVKPAVGTGRGPVNRILDTGATLATTAPYLVIGVAVLISGAGVYGATDIDASFEQSDFLAEDPADWVKDLPEPFAPRTYTAETAIDTLDSNFVRRDTTATILVRGDVTDPETLDRLETTRENASDMSVTETYADGEAAVTDPITVMDRVADENDSFNETFTKADTDGDGVPDRNVTGVYDELYRVAPDEAGNVIHRDDGEYRALRMVVTVNGDADGEDVTDQMDWVAEDVDGDGVSAIATGDVIVNQITADQLAETAILSLVVAFVSVLVVITIAYRITEGSATLGLVTIAPVAFTLTWVLGTMAVLEIPFNIVTGMITGLTIGMGVDYSLHISERFNQELEEVETVADALHETVIGTGGALLSSATTTAAGFAVLLVAILPFLQSFGLITALTIVFAFLASVFVLPSLLAVWAGFTGYEVESTMDTTDEFVPGEVLDDVAVPDEPRATRTIDRQYVLPDQSIPVTVSIRGVAGRASLRERVPGDVEELDVSPDPVALDRHDGTVSVLWDVESPSVEATVSYTTALPDGSEDGDEIRFEGGLEHGGGAHAVEGEERATVVGDVFQRVIARGGVTGDDIEIALERDDVTAAEFDRLRQAWLDDSWSGRQSLPEGRKRSGETGSD